MEYPPPIGDGPTPYSGPYAYGKNNPPHPEHGRHWELARYELPIKEIPRVVRGRTITDIEVGTEEKLAYVHRFTGKRVEFTRPRLDNTAAYLEEAQAKYDCELAIAEANKRQRATNVVGFIDLAAVRTNEKIVADWNRKAASCPEWVRYPTKLHGVPGAFGRTDAERRAVRERMDAEGPGGRK